MADEVSMNSELCDFNTDVKHQCTTNNNHETCTNISITHSTSVSDSTVTNTVNSGNTDTQQSNNDITYSNELRVDYFISTTTSCISATDTSQQSLSHFCNNASTSLTCTELVPTADCTSTNTDHNIIDTHTQQLRIDVSNISEVPDIRSETENEIPVWDCTSEELQFMSSCSTNISNTQSSPLTTDEVSAHRTTETSTPKQPKYIYVKDQQQKAQSNASKKRSISPHRSRCQIDLLQLKIDCLIDKVEHVSNWTTAYLTLGDTQTTQQELRSLREMVAQSKISIHETCAKVRQQLQ